MFWFLKWTQDTCLKNLFSIFLNNFSWNVHSRFLIISTHMFEQNTVRFFSVTRWCFVSWKRFYFLRSNNKNISFISIETFVVHIMSKAFHFKAFIILKISHSHILFYKNLNWKLANETSTGLHWKRRRKPSSFTSYDQKVILEKKCSTRNVWRNSFLFTFSKNHNLRCYIFS